jgi:uncharacterized protein YigA (DUF484 family)
VLLLRQVAGQHKAEFDHLVSVARENEAIMQKTRRLIVAGLECQTLEDFRITLDDMVRQNFTNAQHALHLFDGNPSIKAQLKKVLPEQGCYYGRLSSIELECLFGNTSGSIRSAAVLPLRSNSQGRVSCYGVVALGSDSSDMFSTRKGGLFLEYLTELLSAIVLRLVL